jgi:PKD repeat protein
VSDPDGDALTYAWSSTDNSAISSTSQAASHVFARSGAFEVRLTVADARGLATTATSTVNVGNLSGTWDVTCDSHPASFPSQFVVSLTQSEALLSGNISGGGQSQNFPAPPTAAEASLVSDPKHVIFGVETAFNVWAGRDGDFYFHMTADDTLNTMSGSSQYCGSATSRRR